MRYLLLTAVLLLAACSGPAAVPPVNQAAPPATGPAPPPATAQAAPAAPAEAPTTQAAEATAPAEASAEPPPAPAVSVYVEPPLSQPAPIAVSWAPPPMLVDTPPPAPDAVSVWVGGYWVWEGDWVWAHGHWLPPPRPQYAWVHPYYENRGGVVIFVNGHWAPPGVVFTPPAPGLHLTVEVPALGVHPGPRPLGPDGCFVPAPPGSRLGLIVPAPIGTPPAVVVSAPPVREVGMRITANTGNTTIINKSVTNVTIIAPASATLSGKEVRASVPAQSHLAASLTPVVRVQAPTPQSTKPIAAYTAGKPPAHLPQAQTVSVANPGRPGETARAPEAAGRPQAGEAGRTQPPGASGSAAIQPEPLAPGSGAPRAPAAKAAAQASAAGRPQAGGSATMSRAQSGGEGAKIGASAAVSSVSAQPRAGGAAASAGGGAPANTHSGTAEPPAAGVKATAAKPESAKPEAAKPEAPKAAAATASAKAAPAKAEAAKPAAAKPAEKASNGKDPQKGKDEEKR